MKKILKWLTVVLWMILIFCLSNQPAAISNNQSTEVTEKIAQVTVSEFSQKPQGEQRKIVCDLNPFIRKCAHTFLFAVLGVLLLIAFLSHRMSLFSCGLYSAAVVFLYAVFDEFHQHFISGRGPLLSDVCLDTASGVAALLLFGLGIHLIRKRRKNRG